MMAPKSSVLKVFKFNKCPFYFMTASWRRNVKALKKICRFPLLDLSPMYGIILGVLGMCLSLYDIINVVKDGQSSPNKFSEAQEEGPKFLKSTHERDFKLINLVLSFEYYTLIVVGAGLRKPGLLVPWLTLYAFIIIGDIIVFFVQLCNDGCNFDKNFLCSGYTVSVQLVGCFCLFLHIKMDKKF